MGINDGSGIPKIMVFRPTLEDMKDFSKYLEKMESEGANKAGLAKIIPPNDWCPRKDGYDSDDVLDMVIKAPIQQAVHGRQGLYQQYNIQKKAVTVRDFRKLADSPKYRTPEFFDYEDLERKYWKNVSYNAPIYGADVPGTLYDEGVECFNINHLNTILDLVNESYGIQIMGVNTAYLYFGMWKTTFAWHTEDMDLYSINYLHFGAPKSWYAIPPEHGRRLERLATGFFPSSAKSCPAFLRHKMTLISPAVLKQYSIPFNKITQEPGEFMITFPYAYHAGYNHGYNCAESTNFALRRWVEYGKRASKCMCRSDSVKISMETFVKKFQPERYDLWLSGKDIGPHPEDPTHISAAPPPSEYELAVLSKVNKSKRHPPYKRESLEDSDTEEYSDDSCDFNEQNGSIPTKAAKKLFEGVNHGGRNGYCETTKTPSYLKTSPPHFEDTFKELHRQATSRKRKRTSSEASDCHGNDTYPKPLCCTKPNTPLDSMSWPTISNPAMPIEVSEMMGKLLDSPKTPGQMWDSKKESKQPLSDFNAIEYNHTSISTYSIADNAAVPPPPLLCYTQNKGAYYSPYPENEIIRQHNGSQNLPPPPPLTQHHSVNFDINTTSNVFSCNFSNNSHSNHIEAKTIDYDLQHYLSNSLLESSEPSKHGDEKKLTDPEYVLDDSCVQQLVELPSGKAEACTSTDDLLVNEIIVKTKTVQSSELLKLVHSGNSNSDVHRLLSCVPVPLHLYQHLPYNYFGEQLYNSSISSIYPHCSICILLKKFEINNEWPCAQPLIPSSSRVLIPNAAFAFKVIDQNTTLDEIESSPLLVCSDCKICVHAVCYGVVNKPLQANWKCDRCEQKKYGIHCHLCPLRGGALKPSEDPNVWAHISCVLMQPDAKFKNGISKSPVEISGVKKSRGISTLRCVYCQKNNKPLAEYITGYCIQCYKSPKCSSAFHVTCGYLAGAVFEASDWPDPIRAFCKKCISSTEIKRKSYMEATRDDVDLHMTVIAKHKNNRYYKATVKSKKAQTCHHVHFLDNSFSENVRDSDFISHNMDEISSIGVGDQVRVLWNKEQLSGKYSGSHVVPIYTLMFEDGSHVNAKRDEFFLETEPLPKRVEAKLSMATEQKHNALFLKSEKTEKYLKE